MEHCQTCCLLQLIRSAMAERASEVKVMPKLAGRSFTGVFWHWLLLRYHTWLMPFPVPAVQFLQPPAGQVPHRPALEPASDMEVGPPAASQSFASSICTDGATAQSSSIAGSGPPHPLLLIGTGPSRPWVCLYLQTARRMALSRGSSVACCALTSPAGPAATPPPHSIHF